jgi:hypothetical protein
MSESRASRSVSQPKTQPGLRGFTRPNLFRTHDLLILSFCKRQMRMARFKPTILNPVKAMKAQNLDALRLKSSSPAQRATKRKTKGATP